MVMTVAETWAQWLGDPNQSPAGGTDGHAQGSCRVVQWESSVSQTQIQQGQLTQPTPEPPQGEYRPLKVTKKHFRDDFEMS